VESRRRNAASAEAFFAHAAPTEPRHRAAPVRGQYLRLGAGWIDPHSAVRHYFDPGNIPQACYAHAWDASGTRLFACGGPLAYGTRGGYIGLWE
jgi:hypothetical protein